MHIDALFRDVHTKWRAFLGREDGHRAQEVHPDTQRPDKQVSAIVDWSDSPKWIEHLLAIKASAELGVAIVALPDLDVASKTFGLSYTRALEESFISTLLAAMPSDATVFRLSIGLYAALHPDVQGMAQACRRLQQMRLILGGAAAGQANLSLLVEPRIRHFSSNPASVAELRKAIEDVADELLAERVFPGMDLQVMPEGDANKSYAKALIEADRDQEMYVVVQPVIRLRDEKTIGGEVLLRWKSATLGHVSPGVFIPLAEQVGLIDRISFLVLDRALALLSRLHHLKLNFTLAINLSPNSLNNPAFCAQIIHQLKEHSELCQHLSIEITERYRLSMTPAFHDFLRELEQLNVSFLIDDFGAGNASLSLLKDCRISTLKLAGELAEEVRTSPDNHQLVSWLEQIVLLSHGMGARVLAEGIETPAELAVFKRIGVDEAQGYLFAKPMSVDDFVQHLEHQSNNPLS